MQHFPIFLSLDGQRVVISGAGQTAEAKLRLLLKTGARLHVLGRAPSPAVRAWASEGRIALDERPAEREDFAGARLVYAANDDAAEDARVAALARAEGALVLVVDNLEASDFITPAIVDRDPVVVAIGTEGTAPVLARQIKARVEEMLPSGLGRLARLAGRFRPRAETLPAGRPRRTFWRDLFFGREEPETLLARHLARADAAASGRALPGRVEIVGAGPGDPELLTLRARAALHEADVVIHDALVPLEILELARREALFIDAGKRGYGAHTPQEEINAAMVAHARAGAHVVRLKGGDPAIFARLEEELDALEAAGIPWSIVPGITAASAAAARLGRGLTARGRNAGLRIVTAHDARGFAEADWRALAAPGAVAAIYMGKRAARFLQGRLMMHGAAPETPVSVVENATRPDERIFGTTLAGLAEAVAPLDGPAVILLGLAPRAAGAALETIDAETHVQSMEMA